MSGNEEVELDGSRPATLHNGAISTDFPTLLEAIMAWHRLRPEQAQRASIRIIGGKLYGAAEISVSEVRGKIAKACNWADGSVDEPTGSIDQQEKR